MGTPSAAPPAAAAISEYRAEVQRRMRGEIVPRLVGDPITVEDRQWAYGLTLYPEMGSHELPPYNLPVCASLAVNMAVLLFELLYKGCARTHSYLGAGWIVASNLECLVNGGQGYRRWLARKCFGAELDPHGSYFARWAALTLLHAVRGERFDATVFEGEWRPAYYARFMHALRTPELLESAVHMSLPGFGVVLLDVETDRLLKFMQRVHETYDFGMDDWPLVGLDARAFIQDEDDASGDDASGDDAGQMLEAGELERALQPVEDAPEDPCAVCREPMEAGAARKSRCGHVLHLVCWARVRAGTCPMCRAPLVA